MDQQLFDNIKKYVNGIRWKINLGSEAILSDKDIKGQIFGDSEFFKRIESGTVDDLIVLYHSLVALSEEDINFYNEYSPNSRVKKSLLEVAVDVMAYSGSDRENRAHNAVVRALVALGKSKIVDYSFIPKILEKTDVNSLEGNKESFSAKRQEIFNAYGIPQNACIDVHEAFLSEYGCITVAKFPRDVVLTISPSSQRYDGPAVLGFGEVRTETEEKPSSPEEGIQDITVIPITINGIEVGSYRHNPKSRFETVKTYYLPRFKVISVDHIHTTLNEIPDFFNPRYKMLEKAQPLKR